MKPSSIAHDKAEQFILAGRATVIFHNPHTRNSHKYRIVKHQDFNIWYVNTADHVVNKLVGRIFAPNSNHTTHWFRYDETGQQFYPQDAKVFMWMWSRIVRGMVPPYIDIKHAGACGYCGRPLTDPTSLNSGFGPECRKRLGIEVTPLVNQG